MLRVYKSRALHFDTVKMANGRYRKLYQTEIDKVVEFPVYESAEAHMTDLQGEVGDALFTREDIKEVEIWIERQMQSIDAAFRKMQAQGLMGGIAVVKRSRKDDDTYGAHPDFIADAKIGEFIGVIRGAQKFEPKMRKKVSVPKIEVSEDTKQAAAWNDGRYSDLANELIIKYRTLAKLRGRSLKKAFTKEEIEGLFTAHRVIARFVYYQCGYQRTPLMDACEDNAKDKLNKIMEMDTGKAQELLD